jgi:8-oxo-dGTP pyrophosphatase MutT (NUDIX family)
MPLPKRVKPHPYFLLRKFLMHSKKDFTTAVSKLEYLNPKAAFWIREDYAAVEQFVKSGIMSIDNAEAEFKNLTDEVLGELDKLSKIKYAGVMLIIKDGLILGISRRHDKTIFGLPGGKFDPERLPVPDKNTMDTAIAETREETGVIVKNCTLIYERVELGDGPNGVDYYSRCYYANEWEGEPHNSEEGEVKWLTAEEVTATKAAFADYNRKTLDLFKTMFLDVYIKGE